MVCYIFFYFIHLQIHFTHSDAFDMLLRCWLLIKNRYANFLLYPIFSDYVADLMKLVFEEVFVDPAPFVEELKQTPIPTCPHVLSV